MTTQQDFPAMNDLEQTLEQTSPPGEGVIVVQQPRETTGSSDGAKKRKIPWLTITIVCVLVVVVSVMAWYFVKSQQGDIDRVATCADCHCIVGEGETCPSTMPGTYFTKDEIDTWASQIAMNAYTLDCDPYDVTDCQTSPPQDQGLVQLGVTAVCAVHFAEDFDGENYPLDCQDKAYRLQTYSSQEEAELAGGFVTHVGHCGVCSTLQDLAAYLKNMDLSTNGRFCAKQGSVFQRNGVIDCYTNLGMTEPCATMWAHNSWNTAKNCASQCLLDIARDEPNNGPEPECKLNECLQCDEDKSGPLFRQFAGRTRRNSGLLSEIARPCDSLVYMSQKVCPITLPFVDES